LNLTEAAGTYNYGRSIVIKIKQGLTGTEKARESGLSFLKRVRVGNIETE